MYVTTYAYTYAMFCGTTTVKPRRKRWQAVVPGKKRRASNAIRRVLVSTTQQQQLERIRMAALCYSRRRMKGRERAKGGVWWRLTDWIEQKKKSFLFFWKGFWWDATQHPTNDHPSIWYVVWMKKKAPVQIRIVHSKQVFHGREGRKERKARPDKHTTQYTIGLLA